ncbi:hypothetical protein CBR_g34565 [Chara braunii]|uniref:Reverse transcriptase RNase H-like domain-containing protein n=1 Tax=Chara braunii TaxID=69332 RepID=A0A388LJ53_CHABU|nr:hypothetical protein CBR_g34565 [Chara braunii]|eukprot:GBG82281.1 hypothetical protein CBR_g34565 [Chara braunii]
MRLNSYEDIEQSASYVLEQHDGDDWHPVEYFSHKVTPINSLDDARKELLEFVMALKRWRHFLLGRRRFTWVADNNPLTYYKTQDSSTIRRWMYFIDQFDFRPKHLAGLSNRAADALSRRSDLCAMTHHPFAFDEELQRHFIRGYKFDPNFATLYAQLSSDHPSTSNYRIIDECLLLHSRGKDSLCTAQMMLRTLIRPDQKDWVDRLPDIEFAYKTSLHPGDRRDFVGLLLPRTADIDAACSPASIRNYRELLAQVRIQQQANRSRMPCPIRAGDLVWISAEEFALKQDVSCKVLPKWFGPWTVLSATGDEPDGPSFVIDIPPHLPIHPVFHASKLVTYTSAKSDDFPGRRWQDPPSMDGHQEDDCVITGRKYENKPRQYKVTFKACDPDNTRWISGADLQASTPLIYAHYKWQRLAQEA